MTEPARLLPVWRQGAFNPDAAWLSSGSAPDEAALADALRFPALAAGQSHVRGVMVASLDGHAVGPDGSSRSITTPEDYWAFVTLRFLGDVIVTGSATARAEQTRLPRGRESLRRWRRDQGLTEAPRLAIPTLTGSLPRTDLFSREGACLVLTTADRRDEVTARLAAEQDLAPGVSPRVITCAGDGQGVTPAALMAALVDEGLSRITCEGGPSLLGSLLAAGLVDEVSLSTTHLLAGGEATPFAILPAAVRALRRRLLLVGPTADVALYDVKP
ncbi:dihydrofolate reductase family protein [Micrococcales bacterium 31B]|nr:dihydrofolate reductase family protein [Micrococcales bacterium 31B]